MITVHCSGYECKGTIQLTGVIELPPYSWLQVLGNSSYTGYYCSSRCLASNLEHLFEVKVSA